jgi:hypothetical protein
MYLTLAEYEAKETEFTETINKLEKELQQAKNSLRETTKTKREAKDAQVKAFLREYFVVRKGYEVILESWSNNNHHSLDFQCMVVPKKIESVAILLPSEHPSIEYEFNYSVVFEGKDELVNGDKFILSTGYDAEGAWDMAIQNWEESSQSTRDTFFSYC